MRRDYIETPELNLIGSHQIRRTAVSGTTLSVDKYDYLIECDTSDAVCSIDLRTPTLRNNQQLVIKDVGSNAGSNSIIILTEGGATSSIDGEAGNKHGGSIATSIDTNHGYISLYSDGTQFWTTGKAGTF